VLRFGLHAAAPARGARGRGVDAAVRPDDCWRDAGRRARHNNTSTDTLDIYVNGNFKMTVGPGTSQSCVIEHHWNPTILTAYGNQDSDVWGPMPIMGKFTKYTWNIK
jgi:hypothetical protein